MNFIFNGIKNYKEMVVASVVFLLGAAVLLVAFFYITVWIVDLVSWILSKVSLIMLPVVLGIVAIVALEYYDHNKRKRQALRKLIVVWAYRLLVWEAIIMIVCLICALIYLAVKL